MIVADLAVIAVILFVFSIGIRYANAKINFMIESNKQKQEELRLTMKEFHENH